ncbi:MAG: glycine--tRNA ligase subunit beta [Anaerolineales bacterium]|nr:glycine--tRNA ligase subunit beta [Anaerolineales bacterium]
MALTLQDVILKLHNFWSEQGCVIWQPYNIQVGAGTNNPATLLRVLGPEPWRVGYVEPSVRPDDGRYAENPNRMQTFFQYQVILKPDPGNSQELYLESLKAIGIDPRQQDIRFVEDNWESPALGAWGLGWEVWLNGQEITQFTYFQQAGGLPLDPVAVEITYGLERIVLALQGVDAVWNMEFHDGILYGDVFRQSEIEHCRYYFEIADVEGLKVVFNTYEAEYRRALEAGAVIPAYDYILKCSHLFNVLDTRGAIGVTERAYYFRRMRDMTRTIARAFLDQRAALEYPLVERMKHWQVAEAERTVAAMPSDPAMPADFLLEIGVEEMPAADVDAALAQLRESVPSLLAALRLSHDGVKVFGTPRRLAVLVRNLAARQTNEVQEFRGPPIDRAYDANGNPTPAAEGFARKQGVNASDLIKREVGDQAYVYAVVEMVGRPVTEVLVEEMPKLIAKIKFEKGIRWNASGVMFSRPLRWYVALYGDQVLPFSYAGVYSDNLTRGLRPYDSPVIRIADPSHYLDVMREQGIILDRDERRQAIWEQAQAIAQAVGGRIPDDPSLLDEVTNLVERPTLLRGQFDERFLELPREVLVTVMRKHQRYFAVEDDMGRLMPYFITARNGDAEHMENVVHGNEHVLIARFSDAAFFYREDIQHPLESYLPRLHTLTFQEQLGSMLDKNERIHAMVEAFADLVGAAEDVVPITKRAAHLAKADLATQMVVELTSLQGVMGRIYAEKGGEEPEVANAIFQHWLPRGADDILPKGAPGVLLALLDRLDSLVGLFAVGLAPTAGADPFALRRAALGVIQILLDQNLELDLVEAVDLVAGFQPIEVTPEAKADVLTFIAGRLRVVLNEQDYPHDVIEAILAEQGHNPVRALEGVRELQRWLDHEEWTHILDSFARCVRIVRDKPAYDLHAERFTEEAEKELFEVYMRANRSIHRGIHNVDRFLSAFVTMIPNVTFFFDEILVMHENQQIRENRLALLQHIAGMAKGLADMSQLQGF